MTAIALQSLPQPTKTPENLQKIFDLQRGAFLNKMYPSHAERIDRLDRLLAMIEKYAPKIVETISADFGHRAAQVTLLTDIGMTSGQIKHTRRKLKKWMKTRSAPTALAYRPGWNRIMPQPLGVVGIVGPWNFPFLLSAGAAIGPIAAGNCVMIKPSEQTPQFSALLATMVAEFFKPHEIAVVMGGPEIGKAFVQLPFDHLLFTGGTAVGRSVAVDAAANMTPVTLELGGKSPAIINPEANFEAIAPRILIGKLMNCGQTCIAPDYLALPRGTEDRMVAALKASAEKMFPTIANNPDYTAVVNDRHLNRIQSLVEDARQKGATIIPLHPEGEKITSKTRQLPPIAVVGVNDTMRIMQEEIFGPVLPIVTYSSLDEIIGYVNKHDRPLSLYWFGKNSKDRKKVLNNTVSGGVTINDCVWHFGQEDMPFGGVGASGQGAYHGEYGFRQFSKDKPIFYQPSLSGISLLYPPYGGIFNFMMKVLKLIS